MKEITIDVDLLFEELLNKDKKMYETVKSLIDISETSRATVLDTETMKKHHFCIKCGHKDAYTLSGRSLCSNCCEKSNKWYSEHKTDVAEAKKKQRLKRIEMGVCTVCGKQQADEGHKTCTECRTKNNLFNKYKRRRKSEEKKIIKDSLNLCHKCGRNERLNDKLVCQECYDILLQRMEKARKAVDRDYHWWKQDNEQIFKKGDV